MGATDSIKYRIAENIVTTMQTITTVNGYKYNVPSGNVFIANVITEIPDPTKPAILVDILNSSPVEDQGHTIVWEYAYMVRFYNVHSTENPSINTDNANVEADVIKALKVDVTRGGLAHYTEAGECSPAFDPEIRAPYHEMVILVLTTINGSNPYST